MSAIEDIKNLKIEHFAIYSIVFLSIIAPGLLLIYLYKPFYLESFGILQLILFSAALSLPMPTVNTFLTIILAQAEQDDLEGHVIINMIFSFIGLYIAIMISYLWLLSFKQFLITASVLEVIILIIFAIDRYDEKKKS